MKRALVATTTAVAVFAPASAQASELTITPPATAWVLEDGAKVKIAGTAAPSTDGSDTAEVVALVQRSPTCAGTPPGFSRSDYTVADFPDVDRTVAGAFSITSPIMLLGRGTLCAWLREDGVQTVTVASARLVPHFRVPKRPGGFPFFVSYPRGSSGGLTSYVSAHRLTKFTAQCANRNGPHDRQRFTLVRAVTPDPLTGAFSVSGTATPDNSSNYDAPIPRPFHGKAKLTLTGSLYVARSNMQLRASYTLKAAGLRCSAVSVRGLGT